MKKQKINDFKQFMAEYWPEYLHQQNDVDNVITYVYDDPGEQPSCLLSFILFLFGVIPGVLYLVLGGRKPERHVINVHTLKDSNLLKFSGDTSEKISKSYKAYQEAGKAFNIKKYKKKKSGVIIAVFIWIIILLILVSLASNS